MPKSKQIWVSPNSGGGWKVKQPDNLRASAIVSTKKEAIDIAQDIARNRNLETKIQGLDGKIQGGNSYGNDPCPPRDKNR